MSSFRRCHHVWLAAFVFLLNLCHQQVIKASYMTHSTWVCAIGGLSYAPIVEQYLLDKCLPVRGATNKYMKYTAEASSSGINLILKQRIFNTKYNNCSTSTAQSTSTVVTDPYVCGSNGVQGSTATNSYTAPTNVYALTRCGTASYSSFGLFTTNYDDVV